MPETRLRHYRTIARASRLRLDRARWLFARLSFHRVRRDPLPKLAHHEAAEAAKRAGIYSPNTATGDVEFSLALKWCRLFGGARTCGSRERFVKANGIDFRYQRYEVEQLRAKRRMAGEAPEAGPMVAFPGGFWGE